MPEFSLIIPTYNRCYILWQTLLSIKRQTFVDFEVLVIDDGSTDGTDKLLGLFADDPRFSYHLRPKKGVSEARQFGLEQARGAIISYVDSDDPVFAHYLQTAHAYFSRDIRLNYCLSNCNFYVDLVDAQNHLLESKHLITHQTVVSLDDIYHWQKRVALGTGLFFKRDKFISKVKWNNDLPCFEDLDFVMQLACIDPQGYGFILEPIFDYHQRYGLDGACSAMSYKQWEEAFGLLLELHGNDPLLLKPEIYREKIAKYMQKQLAYEAGQCIPPQLKYFPEFFKDASFIGEPE